MILFAAAWDLPIERRDELVLALRRAAQTYPVLDAANLTTHAHGRAFLVAATWPADKLVGRHPIDADGERTVLVHGSPAAPGYDARDAREIARRWDALPGELEGPYTLVRAAGDGLEVITEAVGFEPVYLRRDGDAWLVASSVAVLAQVGRRPALDPAGAAQLLSIGWAAGDRTLRAGVHVLPCGARWKIGGDAPVVRRYFDVEQLAGRAERRSLDDVADATAAALAAAARPYPDMMCGLTAGRDSRLVLALARAGKVPIKFFTSGQDDSLDVIAAKRLCALSGMPHLHHPVPKAELFSRWDELAERLVAQNDGMVSLWQIFDVLHQPPWAQPERLNLSGAAGEIARGTYHDPTTLTTNDVGKLSRHLVRRLCSDHGGLVTREGVALARTEIGDTVQRLADASRSLADVPDLLYVIERVRRWGGALIRRSVAAAARYYPLVARPFIVEAFARSAVERAAETLHHDLIDRIAPDLGEVPYANGPWRPRADPLSLPPTPKPAQAFRQGDWLEEQRERLRAKILDRASSPLWDVVDRASFEQLMAPDAPADARAKRAMGLYLVATLFEHERLFLA